MSEYRMLYDGRSDRDDEIAFAVFGPDPVFVRIPPDPSSTWIEYREDDPRLVAAFASHDEHNRARVLAALDECAPEAAARLR